MKTKVVRKIKNQVHRGVLTGRFYFSPTVTLYSDGTIRANKKIDVTDSLLPYLAVKFQKEIR